MKYQVECACAPDIKADLQGLWKRNLPIDPESHYGWMYQAGGGRSWLVQDDTGQPVGSTGLMRRPFKVGDALRQGGFAVDMNVDRAHRILAPAVALQRAVATSLSENDLDLILGLPVPAAQTVMQFVGYRMLGCMEAWTKLLKTKSWLDRRLGSRFLASGVAKAADAVFWLNPTDRLFRKPANCDFEVTDHFDDRFDRLWQRASGQFSIIGARTSDFLSWRFTDCPDLSYRTFCLTDHGTGELLGYVVFFLDGADVAIADCLFVDDTALNLLLGGFVRFARRNDYNAIRIFYLGTPRVTRQLRRWGFFQRLSEKKVLILAAQALLRQSNVDVLDRDNWFLTGGDGDSDT